MRLSFQYQQVILVGIVQVRLGKQEYSVCKERALTQITEVMIFTVNDSLWAGPTIVCVTRSIFTQVGLLPASSCHSAAQTTCRSVGDNPLARAVFKEQKYQSEYNRSFCSYLQSGHKSLKSLRYDESIVHTKRTNLNDGAHFSRTKLYPVQIVCKCHNTAISYWKFL